MVTEAAQNFISVLNRVIPEGKGQSQSTSRERPAVESEMARCKIEIIKGLV